MSDDRSRVPRISTDPASVRKRVEALEKIMDVILDLVPFAGSTAGAVLGAYMAWEARNLGMPKSAMTRMAGNVGVDWLLGLIPWVGAVPDFFFRSNTRNLRIIKRHLDRHHPASATVEGSVTPR